MMSRALMIVLTLWALIISVEAAYSPPSFCRCTCFSNSTIIPLSSHVPAGSPPHLDIRAPTSTCTLCNRAFCLAQRLPICKNAGEKDVATACFQRDSKTDQIVVIAFITGTLGLLGWALVRKILEKRKVSTFGGENVQQGYVAVGQ